MTGDDKSRPPSKRIEVVLRDLEGLLRKKLGDSLIVDSFTTSNLVPPGENYGSTMLKVDAEVRRGGLNSEAEKLSLVAKMTPPTEFQKLMFDSPYTFRKEIYMFTDIVPAYKALELECGIPEAEVFDPLPKLYGSRLSLDEGEDKFDEDAVILMENLKQKNYACGDRKVGFDLETAKSVVEALAHFHALGIALKLRKPDLFEEIKVRAESMELIEELMSGTSQTILADAKKIPALTLHLPKIEEVILSSDAEKWLKPPVEPWGTIVHTDFWVNNIMLSKGESGNPEGVKIVDFQNYLYQNPMRDLVFFIFSSCLKAVRNSHVEELIDLYYKKMIFYLTKLELDMSLFSRESFDEQLGDAASLEYLHCVLMARIILAEHTDPSVSNPELMFAEDSSEQCRERMAEVTMRFIKKNWI